MSMDKEEAQDLLPEIGEKRIEVPTISEDGGYAQEAKPCTVVLVNRQNLWYMVEFACGLRECYKVPRLEIKKSGGGSGR